MTSPALNSRRTSLVVVDGVRTPFLKMGSDFAGIDATEQGRIVVQTLLTRTGLDPTLVDEVLFGCVAQPADAANIARVIALRAGIPESVPAMTVHRNCGSGLEALTTAAERISAGKGEVFIVGGTESMSRIPLYFSVAAATRFAALMRAKTAGGRVADRPLRSAEADALSRRKRLGRRRSGGAAAPGRRGV